MKDKLYMILSIIFLIIIIVLGISIRKYNIENRRLQDIVNYYNSIDSNVVEK